MTTSIRTKLLGSFLLVATLMLVLGIVAITRLGAVEDAAGGVDAAQAERIHDAVASGRTWTIVLVVVGALVAVGLALLLGRQVAGGLRQLVSAARGIAGGDVEQQVKVSSRDEIGQTAEAFGAMIAYLEEMAQAARRIAAGDLTVEVKPKSDRDALGTAFAAMSTELHEALGDSSCLDALLQRMDSMSSHCMIDLESALTAARDGDLTLEVTPVTSPISAADGAELGRLAEIFNTMLGRAKGSIDAYNAMRGNVAELLREISRETQAVAAASQQMATTSEESGRAVTEIATAVGEVAAGAERQVRTVSEARELSEEVVLATRSSSEEAAETARAAAAARQVAEDGADAIARATEGMRALEQMSDGVSEAMRSLGAKSDEIGGIVGTITGIAEQTNLLALNAAIEAARAGEQGRGFAVVAEEVRKLAEESQQAAASIAGLVGEIQAETVSAVGRVESGSGEIERGVTTVDEARESFVRIGGSVEDMNGRVERIAAAIAQIAERTATMGSNMNDVAIVAEQSSASSEQVSASTQQTSASTQEIAASAQQLANTAEQLELLVSRFTLEPA
ncbi:HAMP domain-containing methyl-accepting chemotaxis protein [Conexibacter sp. JD483]|uniref:methyl-accepting chemotaxis protein n=1 Tax=unclassified Conexibacter TaxID=2627773 RepID=UPI0027257975|nr:MULTISPECIES: HAMP domain-containing methyl-accepting chemotaxis protein [unclassified Conexibacter]MDO8187126.1 HAMP domain-containing methyl-accepting chemotaxis protein [Conexibacter sp. CPCC 205706]MDO8200302.1 HAMP domain-containing methyl-accepting chemotaxis protein [Conexibacter sp. CPCC 205762]MDR9368902.1 HAMP domain-containing methyl-accepting chemotaxis protein [Conexibacter sp. JD483]